jgi:D-alanyl-D-alanine carboxypeptidase
MKEVKIKDISENELLGVAKSPGAQYIAVNSIDILSECYAGYADILTKKPVTTESTFNCFSITKTVTAAAVMLLAEQNKIQLTDIVNPMFSEFSFEYPFTIGQLVSHQAGFPDPIPISWIHLASEDGTFDENGFLDKIIMKHSKQKYKPGTKFSYSSVGYMLLSLIIEKFSGQPYASYISKNILSKLNGSGVLDFGISNEQLHSTGYHPRFSITNLILGFFFDRKKFISNNSGNWTSFNNFYVNGKAYGGLIGNVRGLASYLQLYLSGEMFESSEKLKNMFTEQKPGMAYSWFTGKLNGENYVCHAGGGGGYYCEIRIYPSLKIASAMLRNKSSFGDLRLLDKVDTRTIF